MFSHLLLLTCFFGQTIFAAPMTTDQEFAQQQTLQKTHFMNGEALLKQEFMKQQHKVTQILTEGQWKLKNSYRAEQTAIKTNFRKNASELKGEFMSQASKAKAEYLKGINALTEAEKATRKVVYDFQVKIFYGKYSYKVQAQEQLYEKAAADLRRTYDSQRDVMSGITSEQIQLLQHHFLNGQEQRLQAFLQEQTARETRFVADGSVMNFKKQEADAVIQSWHAKMLKDASESNTILRNGIDNINSQWENQRHSITEGYKTGQPYEIPSYNDQKYVII